MTRQAEIDLAQQRIDELESLNDEELLVRAWDEISALCGANCPPKRWTMSIPVDASRDSDILFGEVLRRFEQLREMTKDRTYNDYLRDEMSAGNITEEEWREKTGERD